jgi:hypothetical protein
MRSTSLQGCELCSFWVVSYFIINRPKTPQLNIWLRHKVRKGNKSDFTKLVPETIFNLQNKSVSLHCVSCISSYSNKNRNTTKAFVRPVRSTPKISNRNQTHGKRLDKGTDTRANEFGSTQGVFIKSRSTSQLRVAARHFLGKRVNTMKVAQRRPMLRWFTRLFQPETQTW